MSTVVQTSLIENRLHVIVCLPRLDASVARDFKSGIESTLQPDLTLVEIDLSGVEFVDSSGVGAILSIYRKLPRGTSRLSLIGVRDNVRAMLEMLHMNELFEVSK